MKNPALKATYNKIARDWSLDHKRDDWYIPVANKLSEMLPKGASILDVGCGQGFKSAFFTKKGFKVTGIDFSEEMIRLAKQEFPKINFSVFDLYDLDKFPGTFDCVFAQAVLLHVPRVEALPVMEMMKNKLNPGGFLYVGVKAPIGDELEKIVRENDYGYEYERFFSYFTQGEVENYFKRLGFEIILSDVSFSGKTNWVQVVGRLGA